MTPYYWVSRPSPTFRWLTIYLIMVKLSKRNRSSKNCLTYFCMKHSVLQQISYLLLTEIPLYSIVYIPYPLPEGPSCTALVFLLSPFSSVSPPQIRIPRRQGQDIRTMLVTNVRSWGGWCRNDVQMHDCCDCWVCSLTIARLSPPSHHPSLTCPQWRGQSWPPAWPGQTQPFCSHLNCALIDSQFLFLPNCFCVLILLRYSLPTVLPTARAQGWTSHLAGNVSFSVLVITIII